MKLKNTLAAEQNAALALSNNQHKEKEKKAGCKIPAFFNVFFDILYLSKQDKRCFVINITAVNFCAD